MQAKFQNPMITNKKYKKLRTVRKHGFQRENSLKISNEKKNKIEILDLPKTPRGTHGRDIQQGIFTIIVQVIEFFPYELRVC